VSYEEMYITEELHELRALSDYEFDSKEVFSNYENRKDAADFTTCIEQMTNEFSTFIEDIIRVKKIFMPFVDELCDHNSYPTTQKVIDTFQRYTSIVSSGSTAMIIIAKKRMHLIYYNYQVI